MNWFNWFLFQNEVNDYFFRFALVLILVSIFDAIPGPGQILYLLILMDIIYWFVHKKPKIKAMMEDMENDD